MLETVFAQFTGKHYEIVEGCIDKLIELSGIPSNRLEENGFEIERRVNSDGEVITLYYKERPLYGYEVKVDSQKMLITATPLQRV